MKEILNKTISKLKFIYSYIKSALFGFLNKKRYSRVRTFVMFIGYPRSGHSLIASLLDAHPNIIIGMEWGVLPHLKMGYRQTQLFYSIQQNSRRFKREEDNIWTGYSYKVENQWQGTYNEIQLIGDKFGGRTSLMFNDDPGLINLIENRIHVPVKYIHVIRNPFDVITTMTKRSYEKHRKNEKLGDIELLPFIQSYFRRVNAIYKLKKTGKFKIYDLFHENFVKNPHKELHSLLTFFGKSGSKEYFRDCVKIVNKEIHKSRYDIEWQEDLIKYVEKNIKKYNFLQRYSWSY